MLHFKRIGILAVILMLSMIQPVARAEMDSNGRYSTTIPFSPLVIGIDNTRLPLISVRINDSVTATFLVDTGANFLAVTNNFAKKLKLTLDKTNQGGYPNTIYGRTVHTTTLAKLQFGNIVINKQPMVVLPPESLAGIERSIDGIIGISFFLKLQCFGISQSTN